MAKTKKSPLSKQIETLYYQHAKGKQISVMNIGKLYKTVENEVAVGVPVEDAVKAAIEVYCEK